MSVIVIIHHEKPMSIMAIVADLREAGYKQKIDFDFQYIPAKFDEEEATPRRVTPRHTIFTFYNESLSSWFALKYS
jgi:hypothetical protein